MGKYNFRRTTSRQKRVPYPQFVRTTYSVKVYSFKPEIKCLCGGEIVKHCSCFSSGWCIKCLPFAFMYISPNLNGYYLLCYKGCIKNVIIDYRRFLTANK